MKIDKYYDDLKDEAGFRQWVQGRMGTVYKLFEQFLNRPVPRPWWKKLLRRPVVTRTHCAVWPDAVGCEAHHIISDRGAWRSWDKLPKWFKRWVQENGKGKYGTHFGD